MRKQADGSPTISFNLSPEQVQGIVKVREKSGMTTGEAVRRACQAIDKDTLLKNPCPKHEIHLTVSMPAELKSKIEQLAESCDMKLSDVIRRAFDAYCEKELGSGK